MSINPAQRNRNGSAGASSWAPPPRPAAAGAAITAFPAIVRADDPIRSIGLGVSVINEIQGQASRDLGFTVRGQALGYGAMFGKMLNQNDQYEVAEGYYNDMDVMWPAGVWQPIDTQRIRDWDKVTNLSKTGRLTPESNPGQGTRPSATFGWTRTAITSRDRRATSPWCPAGTTPTPSATTPTTPAGPSRAGRSCSAKTSRARSPSSTFPRSGSWMQRWPSRGSGPTSSRTRAT